VLTVSYLIISLKVIDADCTASSFDGIALHLFCFISFVDNSDRWAVEMAIWLDRRNAKSFVQIVCHLAFFSFVLRCDVQF
jgi:hypothetical protein